MQKIIHSYYKEILSLLLFFVLSFPDSTALAQAKDNTSSPTVFHLQNYFTEAYLIKGDNGKLILVDTGVPVAGYQDSLVSSIKKLGFKPENIALAIVTHGHGDHAGNARFLQERYHIPVAASKGDIYKFTRGKTDLSKSEDVSIWGNRLRPYSDLSYPAFTPDIIVDNATVDLMQYGVTGKMIPIKGGHTAGDLLILIGNNLFVGDAFVGTFKAQGGGLAPDGHHVREHFFHENKQLADQNLRLIEKIAKDNNVTTIYPTHNGPVSAYELTKYIQEEPLLKLLALQETDRLNDIMGGKNDLLKYLSDNFILLTSEGKEVSKGEFLESYLVQGAGKIESLAAEDFRIVSSNERTAVMTYLETVKLVGKDAKTLLVTETYSKSKDTWQLMYKEMH